MNPELIKSAINAADTSIHGNVETWLMNSIVEIEKVFVSAGALVKDLNSGEAQALAGLMEEITAAVNAAYGISQQFRTVATALTNRL